MGQLSDLIKLNTDVPSAFPNVEEPKPVNQGPVETPTSYVVRKGTQAFGGQVGRDISAAEHLAFPGGGGIGIELPMAALRLMLPKWLVDKVDPFAGTVYRTEDGKLIKRKDLLVDRGQQGEDVGAQVGGNWINTARDIMRGVGAGSLVPEADVPNSPDVGAAPGPISKNLGGVSSFVGGAMGLPIGATPANAGKYIIGAMGMGEGAEVGGSVAKSIAHRTGASPTGEAAAEFGGAMLGGVVGAPANVTRMGITGEIAGQAASGTGRAAKALSSAWNKWKQDTENTRSFIDYFGDEYKHMRDAAKENVQNRVIGTIVRDIKMDPDAPEAIQQWADATAKTGVDPQKFPVAARVTTPSLVATTAQHRPGSPEEAAIMAQMQKAGDKEIMSAAQRMKADVAPPTTDTLTAQLREAQKGVALKVNALNDEALNVAQTTPVVSMAEGTETGQKLRAAFDKELETANAEKSAKFDAALANGETYDLSGAQKKVEAVLGTTLAKIKPDTVPAPIRNLQTLFSRSDPELARIVTEITGNPPPNAPATMRDLHEAIVGLNDASSGMAADNFLGKHNIGAARDILEGVLETQTKDPALYQKLQDAREWFKNNFVPRFRTGTNFNLSREGGISKANENILGDASIIPAYLAKDAKAGGVPEERMQQFDALWGGELPGTQRNASAYNALWRGIEDDYARNVLNKGKFDPAAHDKFMGEYEAALKRTPGLRDKLDVNADRILSLQGEADREAQRFHDITGSPITAALGPIEAKKALDAALNDPKKMGQLVSALNTKGMDFTLGHEGAKGVVREIMARAAPYKENGGTLDYDPKRLVSLLDAGRAGDGSPSSLQVAFRAAFGRSEGDAQMERLRALGVLAQRHALTDPKFLRPMQPYDQDFFKQLTGSSAASWIASLKSFGEGRTGGAWLTGFTGGRFFNSQLKAKLAKMQMDALYDPKTADAILELYSKGEGQPMSKSTAKLLADGLGEGGDRLVKSLGNRGMLTNQVFNGARVTATMEANKKDNDPSNRQRFSKPFFEQK